MKILFICQGNIGRSQIAEALTNHFTNHTAISAGVDNVGEKYNFRPYNLAVELLKTKYGIDMSNQTTKQVKKEMLVGVDEIYLFCSDKECSNKIPEYVLRFDKLVTHYINDPNQTSGNKLIKIIDSIYALMISKN